ncbi:MAG: hypothetical protein PHF67_05395 [Candidatus Nanoarchaeia archaeon]|nr:hypothetical protein [Candidatus Nanoarchaeia archaeon]
MGLSERLLEGGEAFLEDEGWEEGANGDFNLAFEHDRTSLISERGDYLAPINLYDIINELLDRISIEEPY